MHTNHTRALFVVCTCLAALEYVYSIPMLPIQTGMSKETPLQSMHARLHERGSRAVVTARHGQLERLFRADALRCCLLRLAHDAHRFLHMRSAFVRSLAAQLVAGYIAGAGDRHAGNILLDTVEGTLIPIDFGYVE